MTADQPHPVSNRGNQLTHTTDTSAGQGEAATPAVAPSSRAFLATLGLRLTEVTPTRVCGEMQLGTEHHAPWGVVHGGAYTAAVETAASVGASVAVADRGQVAVGLANSTDFLRPMTAGTVEVLAEPIQQGRAQQLWQVSITSIDSGKLVAHGQLRLANVPAANLSGTAGPDS
jgi:1,4-dihydroxy-2-naphthoyl-CoA hydrolase